MELLCDRKSLPAAVVSRGNVSVSLNLIFARGAFSTNRLSRREPAILHLRVFRKSSSLLAPRRPRGE